MKKSTIIINIIKYLSNTKSGYSLKNIMDEFDVSRRSAERYLMSIEKEFHIKIYSDIKNRKKYYKIANTSTLFSNNSDNTDDLLDAKLFSFEMMKSLEGTHFLSSLEDNFLDLSDSKMQNAYRFFTGPTFNLAPYAAYIKTIAKAIRNRKVVSIVYASKFGGNISKSYNISPYSLILHLNTLYFFGKKETENDFRIWVVKRLSSAKILDKKFLYDEDFDINRYFNSSFGIFNGIKAENVVLKVFGDAMKDLKDMNVHSSAKKAFIRGKEMTLELCVTGFEDLKKFILPFADEIEVIKPIKYREEMKEFLSKSIKRYK